MYLAGKTCYLSGPIDYDIAEDWRSPVKQILNEEFKVNVFDPSFDPKQNQTTLLQDLRKQGKYAELSKIAHEFVRADLSIVDHSDFLIAHLPHKVPVFGTIHEIINSSNAKKPTLLVCPQGKDKFSTWPFGFIDMQYLFGSWEDLFNYLHEVDEGLHEDNHRWWFCYNYYYKNGHWRYR